MTVELGRRDRLRRKLLLTSLRLPGRWRRRIAGSPPVNARGVALDPDTHWMLWLARSLGGTEPKTTVPRARDGLRTSSMLVEGAPRALSRVERITLAGRPAVVFAPFATRPPLMLYLHGGGWVAGDLRSHDRLMRRLAAETGWMVVGLDYRLAPEHPFPEGLEDVLAALRQLRDRAEELGADPERIAVGGDSAGGNLSTAACLVLRDSGEPLPVLQVLIYPGLDMRCALPSHREFAEGFFLTEDDIHWYRGHYALPDVLDPRASPLLAADLSGLPPAIVTTAGFDPLRDEGEAYVERLRDAGVPVTHLDAATLVHGYANMDGVLPAADAAVRELIQALRRPPRA